MADFSRINDPSALSSARGPVAIRGAIARQLHGACRPGITQHRIDIIALQHDAR